jgi:carbamoyl-phosphate synthase small subunit
MKGVIVSAEATEAEIAELMATPEAHDQIAQVTTKETYTVGEGKLHVAVLDLGLKKKVTNFLMGMDCHLTVFPAATSAEEILRHNPNGIVITNGPGNPADVPEVVETVKALMGKKPMLGFCMGHLVMALAAGAETSKMKFGHHGNQPVKGLETGRVYISAQNHGYVVDEKSLEGKEIILTHVALNDGTVEGLKYEGKNAMSVQFLPDVEHTYLLDTFTKMMEGR